MQCQQCSTTSRTAAQFCSICGSPLNLVSRPEATSPNSSTSTEDQCVALRQQIADSLHKARTQQQAIKRRHTIYNTATIVLSGLGTLIAGLATLLSQPIADDWSLTCGIAALLSFGTTVVAGLQQQGASPDLLTEANACVARLRALQLEMGDPIFNLHTVKQKYQQIVSDTTRIEC